jgi:hypothetical protein
MKGKSGDEVSDLAGADTAIEISVALDRQAAELLQLEVARLLAQHGLRVGAVTVTRASAYVRDADSAEAT